MPAVPAVGVPVAIAMPEVLITAELVATCSKSCPHHPEDPRVSSQGNRWTWCARRRSPMVCWEWRRFNEMIGGVLLTSADADELNLPFMRCEL